jgi:predicted phage baseplate assembly protein
LLESSAGDRVFVAEIDDDGVAHLRFGDGDLGAEPAACTRFQANYRIGNGPAGNVGRETITYLVLRHETLSGVSVKPRNPLAARGGTAPEPIALAKLLAPYAFRSRRERAITAEDYAELAQRNAAIQRAAGELCWTGSWYEARVSIDPAHSEEADRRLLREICRYLYRYRRMGHDLKVAPAQYVPLEIEIEVCVEPHHTRGEIKARLNDVLSNRQLADGTFGFFHPDRLTFGQGVYVSQIIAAVTAVDGVETARLAKLKRLDGPDGDALASGVLPIGAFEVAQCDNDPNFPEHGKLALTVRGGR